MRSNQLCAVAAAGKSHARKLHACASFLARARVECASVRSRAVAAAYGRFDRILCSVCKTLRNDAVGSIVRGRGGSRIA
eukprot:2940191-Lingulodinium_polyedra.AAC.1